jgi:hypothetical protein
VCKKVDEEKRETEREEKEGEYREKSKIEIKGRK